MLEEVLAVGTLGEKCPCEGQEKEKPEVDGLGGVVGLVEALGDLAEDVGGGGHEFFPGVTGIGFTVMVGDVGPIWVGQFGGLGAVGGEFEEGLVEQGEDFVAHGFMIATEAEQGLVT